MPWPEAEDPEATAAAAASPAVASPASMDNRALEEMSKAFAEFAIEEKKQENGVDGNRDEGQ